MIEEEAVLSALLNIVSLLLEKEDVASLTEPAAAQLLGVLATNALVPEKMAAFGRVLEVWVCKSGSPNTMMKLLSGLEESAKSAVLDMLTQYVRTAKMQGSWEGRGGGGG